MRVSGRLATRMRSQPCTPVAIEQSCRLVIRIQPREGIGLHSRAKRSGIAMRPARADMRVDCRESFEGSPADDSETLLLDVIAGNQTFFVRAD